MKDKKIPEMTKEQYEEICAAPQILMRVTRDFIKELKELGQTEIACQIDGYRISVEKVSDTDDRN